MKLVYIHISVPDPVFIREASSSSRWEQMQRLTARHYVEGESKNLPLDLSGSCERVGRKVVRFRGDGEQQENAAL